MNIKHNITSANLTCVENWPKCRYCKHSLLFLLFCLMQMNCCRRILLGIGIISFLVNIRQSIGRNSSFIVIHLFYYTSICISFPLNRNIQKNVYTHPGLKAYRLKITLLMYKYYLNYNRKCSKEKGRRVD
jgi:hypothetical protein